MSSDNHEIGQATYHEGKAARDKGDIETAVQKLKLSAQLSPHFKTYEHLAECFLERKDYHTAILYAAAAVGLATNSSRGLFLLAKALLRSGDRDKTIDKLNEALEINPDYKAARVLLEEIEKAG